MIPCMGSMKYALAISATRGITERPKSGIRKGVKDSRAFSSPFLHGTIITGLKPGLDPVSITLRPVKQLGIPSKR